MQRRFDFADSPRDEGVEPICAGERRIVVGTCGYSYTDWIGPFYPARLRARDMLPYYASRFGAVEIDSSYYRVPTRAACENFVARTPDEFRFALKLPGTLTHVPLGASAELHPDAATFRENLEPLRESGKILALVMQFPNGFRSGPAANDRLTRLRDAFPALRLMAEFRNREWQNAATLQLLHDLDIGWINVDQPQFDGLLRPSSDVVGTLAYVRFHGRNYRHWWNPPAPADRYTYRYRPSELEPWADRVLDMTDRANQTLVFFNNHRFGNAPLDAYRFAAILRSRLLPGERSAEPPSA